MQKDTKVVFTGGHAATTALAVIAALKIKNPGLSSIYWIGTKKAVEGKSVNTLESNVLPKKDIKFVPLITGKIQQRFTVWTVPSLLKIPFGFIHAFIVLLGIKPTIIVSFGGYSSFPVVVLGWVLGVPVIIHEQVATAGLANRASAFFARKIVLARHTSLKYFPKKKCIVLGNPVSNRIEKVKPKKSLGFPPTILVTCGSRGSKAINNLIAAILTNLVRKYNVMHQVGLFDVEKFRELKKNLPENLSSKYEVYDSIDPENMVNFYSKADIIIARAGANTVSEIIVSKRPAILIPLPFSYLDEQRENARIAEDLGLAKILDQKSTNPMLLEETLENVIKDWEKIVGKLENYKSPDIGAAERMADLVSKYLV